MADDKQAEEAKLEEMEHIVKATEVPADEDKTVKHSDNNIKRMDDKISEAESLARVEEGIWDDARLA